MGEVAHYREELIAKAKIDPSQFSKIFSVLMSRVQQISLDDFAEAELAATKLMEAVSFKLV